jgi:very-short-patch-repair endonuclease
MGTAKLPRLNVGEETLAMHMKVNGIQFEREVTLVPGRKFRTDFLIRSHRLAVEVDGGAFSFGRHTRGPGFEKDCIKLNAIVLEGYRVLRYTTGMVTRGEAIKDITAALDRPSCETA